ncbi:MAG: hypothetical protein ACKVS6_07520 [Planctomycetota bacterium]
MKSTHVGTLLFAAVQFAALLGVSCAAPPPGPAPVPAAERALPSAARQGSYVITLAVNANDSGSVSTMDGPLAQIVAGETIFFSSGDPAGFAQVRLEGDLLASQDCETVQGFQCFSTGATSRAIEPGGIVSLCFHKPGIYKLRFVGKSATLEGYVEVRSK